MSKSKNNKEASSERTPSEDTPQKFFAEQRRKLLEIIKSLHSLLPVEDTMNKIQFGLKEVMSYDSCGLYWYDESRNLFRPEFMYNTEWLSRELVSWEIPLGKGIISDAIKSRDGLLINNAHLDPRASYLQDSTVECEHLIYIPIRVKEKTAGLFFAARKTDPEFSSDEFELVQLFVSQASLAIENARLFEQVNVSEDKFRTLFEDSKDTIFISNPEGKFIDVNAAGLELFGYSSKEELLLIDIGKDLYAEPAARERYQQVLKKNGFVKDYELVLKRKDGEELMVLESTIAFYDKERNIVAYRGIMRDITEKIKAEKRQSVLYKVASLANENISLEELCKYIHGELSTIIDTRNFFISLYDSDKGLVTFPYYADEYYGGVSAREPRKLKKGLTEYVMKTGKPLLATDEQIEELEKKKSVEVVGRMCKVWLGVPLSYGGKVTGVIAVQSYTNPNSYNQKDLEFLEFVSGQIGISLERKRIQQALQESEAKHRSIIDHSTIVFYSHTPDHILTYMSHQTRKFFDCEPEEALVRWTEYVTDNPINKKGFELTQKAIDTGQPQGLYELELVGKKGRVIWVEVNESPVVKDGKTVAIVGSLTDITERKKAAEYLTESERFNKTVIENSPIGITLRDRHGRLILYNDAWRKIWNLTNVDVYKRDSETANLPLQDRYPYLANLTPEIKKVFEEGIELFIPELNIESYETKPNAKWVSQYFCPIRDGKGNVLQVLSMTTDITERKLAEKSQSALYRIVEVSHSAENLGELYKRIHEIIGELMYAKNLYLALLDEDTQMMSFPYSVDEYVENRKPYKIGKGLTGYVIRTGSPLLFSPETKQRLMKELDIQPVGHSALDWLGVPLKKGDKTFGAIVVQSYNEDIRYNEHDKEILTFVSQHIADALERKSAQDAIKENEERTRLIIDTALDAVVSMDSDGKVIGWSPRAEDIFGWKVNEVLGKNMSEIIVPSRYRESYKIGLEHFKKTGEGRLLNKRTEIEALHRDGYEFPIEMSITPVSRGDKYTFSAFIRDITDKKKIEKENNLLFEAGKSLAAVLDINTLYDLVMEIISKVADCDELFVSSFNYEDKMIRYIYLRNRFVEGRFDVSKIPPIPLAPEGYGIVSEVIRSAQPQILNDYQKSKRKVKTAFVLSESEELGLNEKDSGTYVPRSAIIVPIKFEDKVVGVVQIFSTKKNGYTEEQLRFVEALMHQVMLAQNNSVLYQNAQNEIKERKATEEKLRNALNENEVLLKEVHHRIKNNLQVISSLLNLQAASIADDKVAEYLKISQNRVRTMSLIHEKLYRSGDMSNVNFGDYVNDLANHLFTVYSMSSRKIKVNVKAKDVYLSIDTAVPCGLIINELVSNSFKHAFPTREEGIIEINITKDNTGKNFISVKDNGVGIPFDMDILKTKTLGMELVTTLTKQLGGKIEVSNNGGAEFRIIF